MNKRIQQLAESATSSRYQHDPYAMRTERIDRFDKEKFAKLIIQECIDIISPYAIRMENYDSGHPVWDIKKHFGV
jgi:hypothetical protein